MAQETHLSELKVLHRRSPECSDENEWPMFDLADVEVKAKDGELISLFCANQEHPVTVYGKLVVKGAPSKVKNAILPVHRSQAQVPIMIKDCNYFAYGAYTNGEIALWASGKAGWHKICPASTYSHIFKSMIEAVDIMYFLIDCCRDGPTLSYNEIFSQYSETHEISAKEAMTRFYAHAAFLASRMMLGEEGIAWSSTSFYQHLRKVKPEAFGGNSSRQTRGQNGEEGVHDLTEGLLSRVRARDHKSRSSSMDMRASRGADADQPRSTRAQAALAEVPPKRGRPPRSQGRTSQDAFSSLAKPKHTKRPVQVEQPPSQVMKAKAREVWRFMQRRSNETLPDIGEMTIETFARFLYEAYDLPDVREGSYLLKYLGPELIGMMSVPRGRSYDPWSELPIYDELVESKVPPRVKSRIVALKLIKRDRPLPGDSQDSEESESEDEEESIVDAREAALRKRELARRRISGLRPKSASKYSAKAAKRKGRMKGISQGYEEEEDPLGEDADEEMADAGVGTDTGDAMSIDTPLKRKTITNEDDDSSGPEAEGKEPPLYPSKRFTRSCGDIDPELEDLEFEIHQKQSTRIPIRRRPSQSETDDTVAGALPSPMLGLSAEPAPCLESNAPGDMWHCPHTGCFHKVYGASVEQNKEFIRDHLLDHGASKEVDLIRTEESMTRLPVSHLLKRIRDMAERVNGEQLLGMGDGLLGLFPAPMRKAIS